MVVVATRKVVDASSGSYLSRLRDIREKITKKEAEMDRVVAKARRRSNRQVRGTRERLDAEDELEEALVELTILKERRRTAANSSSKATLLQEEINAKRLDLLAASPPYVLKLEQARAVVARVHQADDPGSVRMQTRWRSFLKSLMKDVSDGIDRTKHLSCLKNIGQKADSELALAAASARLLSLHVNAWSTPQLLSELDRIWLQAVRAEATEDPHFEHVVAAWKTACNNLERCVSASREASRAGEEKQNALGARIRSCQIRAGIGPRVEKVGWWRQREEHVLWEELRHIQLKVVPQATASHLAARYNILLARCAEAGAWKTAVAAYRSMSTQGTTTKEKKKKNSSCIGSGSPDPVVYQHLLRAAKNANPPQPRKAFLVLQEMRSRGDNPSVAQYNIVVSACARAAAAAASTSSALMPLEPTSEHKMNVSPGLRRTVQDGERSCSPTTRGFGGGKVEGKTRDGVDKDGTREKNAANSPTKNDGGVIRDNSDDMLFTRPPLPGCTGAGAVRPGLFCIDSDVLASSDSETAADALCLALDVVADMREKGVSPTEVTYKTLVECGRCAGAAASGALGCERGAVRGSAPVDVYTAFKEAGIPPRYCYEAGVKNAMSGGRRYPEYIAEMYRE